MGRGFSEENEGALIIDLLIKFMQSILIYKQI